MLLLRNQISNLELMNKELQNQYNEKVSFLLMKEREIESIKSSPQDSQQLLSYEEKSESMQFKIKELKLIISECAYESGIDQELYENLQLLRRSVKIQRYHQLNEEIKTVSNNNSVLLLNLGSELKDLKYLSLNLNESSLSHDEILVKSHYLIKQFRERERELLLKFEEETAKRYEDKVNEFIQLLNKIHIIIGVSLSEWERVTKEKNDLLQQISQLQGTITSIDLESQLSEAVSILSNENEKSIHQIQSSVTIVQEMLQKLQK